MFRQIHKYRFYWWSIEAGASVQLILFTEVGFIVNIDSISHFLQILTLAWSEVCGRSYGGGVLEL